MSYSNSATTLSPPPVLILLLGEITSPGPRSILAGASPQTDSFPQYQETLSHGVDRYTSRSPAANTTKYTERQVRNHAHPTQSKTAYHRTAKRTARFSLRKTPLPSLAYFLSVAARRVPRAQLVVISALRLATARENATSNRTCRWLTGCSPI
jgi:hypothetical protein